MSKATAEAPCNVVVAVAAVLNIQKVTSRLSPLLQQLQRKESPFRGECSAVEDNAAVLAIQLVIMEVVGVASQLLLAMRAHEMLRMIPAMRERERERERVEHQ